MNRPVPRAMPSQRVTFEPGGIVRITAGEVEIYAGPALDLNAASRAVATFWDRWHDRNGTAMEERP